VQKQLTRSQQVPDSITTYTGLIGELKIVMKEL